ncbi:hypothetical protein D3C86_1904570 [compost metagenome]
MNVNVLEIRLPKIGISPNIKVKIVRVLAKGRWTPQSGNKIKANKIKSRVLMAEICICAKTTFLNEIDNF